MGQPSKLTPERQARIVASVKRGNYFTVAAQAAGICPATLKNWMKWGREGKEPYFSFLAAVKEAAAEGEEFLVGIVADAAASGEWAAACRILEAKSDRWTRKTQQTLVDKRKPAEMKDDELNREVAKILQARFGFVMPAVEPAKDDSSKPAAN